MCNQCGKVVEHMSECSGCARVVLQHGLPAEALGHAQAAVQRLPAMRHGANCEPVLLALQEGQILQRNVSDGTLEPAQERLRRAWQIGLR
jgi:hypothetical protein